MEEFTNSLLDAALANTLAAVQRQVQDWNENLKSNYLTAFDNWSQSVLAGRADNSNPPQPPKGYVVGHFTDPTTGPGRVGPYGETPIQWAYPAQGTDPVSSPLPNRRCQRPCGSRAIRSWRCSAAPPGNPPPSLPTRICPGSI